MIKPEFIIDSVQSTKRAITNAVITDPVLNKIANSYIDAQTNFAKVVVNNADELVKYSAKTVSQQIFSQKEQASKAPYKVEKEAK